MRVLKLYKWRTNITLQDQNSDKRYLKQYESNRGKKSTNTWHMTVEVHLGIQLIHLLFTKALEKAVFGLWYAKFHKVRFENQLKKVLGSD